MVKSIVVVGGGQAAAVAARTVRRRGYDGRIEVIGDELDRPYQRPPLSKEYLETGDDDGLTLLTEQWCTDNDVHLRLGTRVTRVDTRAGAVTLADDTAVPADAVLLATGGRARRLPGTSGDRVHTLRTRQDADRLRDRLRPGATIVVVGAGFIGSEVASTARSRGADVVVLDALDVPMSPVLGAELGTVYADLHRANGVDLRLGETVESITDHGDGVTVGTASGARIDADAVVVGIGIEPCVDVAVNSGIAVDNGICVDASGRTSIPTVFAAGDVANHHHPLHGRRIRAEHVDSATRLATAAADTMLGRDAEFAEPHWFYSDQYGVNLQFTGDANGCDDIVVRGSLSDADFCAFYLREGTVRAAFAAERGMDVMAARELISQAATVDPAVLRDEDVDLFEVSMEGVS